MRTDLVIVAVVVGLGTWLFRFVPTRLRGMSGVRSSRLTGAMESIGPAAIVTLFIAAVLPDLVAGARDRPLILIGCATTVLVFRLKRSLVSATMAGTVAYGLAFGVLGG
ncbi:MAG TPA: AzlD domain-containing protein [Gemmatimonadaceae bacterium]|jgi:branched-subunit amino acid transport protein AzlD|nr:AzlD domain-containing protein [Gemmatimonadaceae bacterium]